MPIFTPEVIFLNVTHISLEYLQQNGIRALVLDVDNTLTGHDSQKLAPEVAQWIETMKQAGIHLMLASNNYKKRVEPFAQQLGIEFSSFSCKPSPIWLINAKKKWNLPKSEIALVGDQIFTDALAGSLYGVKVLLVRPLYQDTKFTIKLKRKLESPFIVKYFKNGGILH